MSFTVKEIAFGLCTPQAGELKMGVDIGLQILPLQLRVKFMYVHVQLIKEDFGLFHNTETTSIKLATGTSSGQRPKNTLWFQSSYVQVRSTKNHESNAM